MVGMIFLYIGSSLGIILTIFKILEKINNLKKKYSKKPEINVSSINYSWGARFRNKKEKEILKSFSEKLPNALPHGGLNLRLINTSKRDNIIDLYICKKG